MEAVPIFDRERIDDLLTQDLKIIQSDDVFSFSLDAVLLARFCSLPQRGRIMDLCTGNGVIPLLLTTRTKAQITAIEIQDKLAEMARRNVRLNGLENQIDIRHGDLRQALEEVGHGLFDALTVNPPYLPVPNGDQNLNEHFAAARHELFCTLEDVIRVSSRLVRTGGKVAMVHRPSRLVDICFLMRQYRIEPKRIRFVHPRADQEANMVLIEGMRDGKPELRTLPPLIVYKNQTEYSDELADVYFGRRLTLEHDPDTY
ncbi:tRNA1(Val) (adenine(37)-N6)-methyltransferase [Paenibacillus puerhi]|uniref:tRNA1(Val) (adenine(37)-N6)-methyltransferase n=1 Tax=Paenibacillus puerhi TaxID=2692622 RepID=UPI001358E625|nr:tRNA1(Val) (adenine(37)-N6)-methyltransferase [Paenibacillus puerhi]